MQKTKTYSRIKFDAKTISAADEEFTLMSSGKHYRELASSFGDEEWFFDTLGEFLAAIHHCSGYAFYVYADSKMHV